MTRPWLKRGWLLFSLLGLLLGVYQGLNQAIGTHGHYAAWKAFTWEMSSVVKPFDRERFARSIERTREALKEPDHSDVEERVRRLLAQIPDPSEFLRVHRSHVVRINFIAELRPMFHGDYELVLRDGQTLSLSRRYKALLPAAIREKL